MTSDTLNLIYLSTAVLFILGLKAMKSPRTARLGNLMSSIGMLLAIAGTLLARQAMTYTWIITGLAIGSVIGAIIAMTVRMTAVPQMVSFFNGAGGLAAALVAMAHFYVPPHGVPSDATQSVTAGLTSLAGWISFVGSLISVAKLQEWIRTQPIVFRFHEACNVLLAGAAVTLLVLMGVYPNAHHLLLPLIAVAVAMGVVIVIPIGGADMPVVIALLNSFTGMAAAATGLMLGNSGLIIAGALVGASGGILTLRMCTAMNRSLFNVLFAHFGLSKGAATKSQGTVRKASPEDAAIVLDGASLVMIIPGYGMAVARAQHAVKELADLLAAKGVTVQYAVHPVAGRMPGHMNVLLAEANVPYDQILDLDQANAEIERADVALVIGANDVTNPAARTDPASPIYGMPVIDAEKARTVFIFKRSMAPGFAGIDNPLFYEDKTMMLFGDAKDTVTELVAAVKK